MVKINESRNFCTALGLKYKLILTSLDACRKNRKIFHFFKSLSFSRHLTRTNPFNFSKILRSFNRLILKTLVCFNEYALICIWSVMYVWYERMCCAMNYASNCSYVLTDSSSYEFLWILNTYLVLYLDYD